MYTKQFCIFCLSFLRTFWANNHYWWYVTYMSVSWKWLKILFFFLTWLFYWIFTESRKKSVSLLHTILSILLTNTGSAVVLCYTTVLLYNICQQQISWYECQKRLVESLKISHARAFIPATPTWNTGCKARTHTVWNTNPSHGIKLSLPISGNSSFINFYLFFL